MRKPAPSTFIALFIWACALSCCGQASGPWDAYLQRCKTHLVKDDTLYNWFSIDARGISMYSDPAAKLKDSVECRLQWGEFQAFTHLSRSLPADSLLKWYLAKGSNPVQPDLPLTSARQMPPYNPDRPLQGMRIALDPGHVGGTMEMGMLEWKYVKINPDPERGIHDSISFNEGNLALGTALILEKMFREAGAEVWLTRRHEGETAFGMDFPGWLDAMQMRWEGMNGRGHRSAADFDSPKAWEEYRNQCAAGVYLSENPLARKDSGWWMNKAGILSIYKGPFLKAEFKERARQIQAFDADLSLIIHYNVLETNEPREDGSRNAVPDNFCMAFVPGAFMKGELSTPEDRLAFLVKLVTDDGAASATLSAEIMRAHTRILDVPPLTEGMGLKYIEKASMAYPDAVAVYARNLALTKQIHGVMCFGESLYQDNARECVALNAKDFVLPGMATPLPNRIKDVAQAYFDGVVAWRKGAR